MRFKCFIAAVGSRVARSPLEEGSHLKFSPRTFGTSGLMRDATPSLFEVFFCRGASIQQADDNEAQQNHPHVPAFPGRGPQDHDQAGVHWLILPRPYVLVL